MMTKTMAPHGHTPLALGSVGWLDDGGDFYFLGTEEDDGAILVRVTLFRGADPTVQVDASQAQGQRILAKLSSNIFGIPPRLTRVLVAIPDGMANVPGGPVVVAYDMASTDSLSVGDVQLRAFSGPGRVHVQATGEVDIYPTTSTATGKFNADGTVDLGTNPTDGIVLQQLLAAQQSALGTLLSAIEDLLSAIAVAAAVGTGASPMIAPGATVISPLTAALVSAISAYSTAMGLPNYSQTCKATE